jgi:hypothetical protein
MPSVQVAYNIIKEKGPVTAPEIMEGMKEKGRKVSGTIIYPLLKRGYIKKSAQEKDGRTAYEAAANVTPTFGAARGPRKQKKHSTALLKATPAPQEIIMSSAQIREQAEEEMALSHTAINSLQKTAATVKFIHMMERVGPEQMLLMLSGLERMHK